MENKFKVGDIVKGISNYYLFTDTRMTRAKVIDAHYGTIDVEVLEHKDKDEVGCTYTNLNSQDFELVSKFEVGNKVTYARKGEMWTCEEVGSIGKIKSIYERQGYGEMAAIDFEDGHNQEIQTKCLELVSDKPKFEKGQVYKSSCDSLEKGNIIKITEADDSHIRYKAIKGNGCGTVFGAHSTFADGLTLLTGSEIGEAIRKWDEEHSPKSEPEYTEVKRHAKVGEKIKIVNPFLSVGYKKGDTLTVAEEGSLNQPVYIDHVKINTHTGLFSVNDSEYVVLEPKQTVREVKRAAKVGEYIKIVNAEFPGVGDTYKNGDIVKVIKDNCDGTVDVDRKDAPYVNEFEYVVLENYKPQGKHPYTAEQIAEAKRFVLDTIREIYEESQGSILFSVDNYDYKVNHAYFVKKGMSRLSAQNGENISLQCANVLSATAKCSSNDEPNEWIGKCVALCKVLHKDIPTWIMEG